MKRIFIALKVEASAELLRMIATFKALLANESITWVDPVNIHITLSFLGDTEEKKIGALANMLKPRCSGFGEFEFNLAGTGVFKNFRDPRVIWVGIQSSEKLLMLSKIISDGLNENGLDIEERQFKPHLTLGRIKSVRDKENLKTVLERYRDSLFETVYVSEVILYESILTLMGPIYIPLGNFMLT